MTSIDDLQARIAFVRTAIERNVEQSRSLPDSRTSGFWADILRRRRNYPDLNEIMVCRRVDSESKNSDGTIAGIGDDPQRDLERERAYSDRVHHIFRRMVSKEFAASLPPESSFGSPLVFEHDGISRSGNFWISAATTSRVLDFVKQYGKAGALRILEIGPGWGACVYQLHQTIDVESYTLVDLPENLYISTIHLGTVLPNRPIQFLDISGAPIIGIPSNTICACLPATIGRIQAQYDLVLNSFSLQEMDLESVVSYIDWIEKVLSPEGIFVSLNSHGKTSLRKPSDYRYEKFHIHHWGVFRPSPSGFFNTIPYEVVVGGRRAQSPDYSIECQDGLGRLMQVGLDRDLVVLCEAFCQGRLDQRQRALLCGYNAFFSSKTDEERSQILGVQRDLDSTPTWPFIAALFSLVRGENKDAYKLFRDAIHLGLGGFARIRAEVFRAGLARHIGDSVECPTFDGFDPAFAYPEAELIVSSGDLDRAIVHINRAFERE